MSNLSINNDNLYEDINFVVKEKNNSINSFYDQIDLIKNNENKNDYEKLINYDNKLKREKNENNNYTERLDNELHTSVYRINNYATFVDDINFSNPVIYPKEYDMYFDFLKEKNIKQINTQILKNKNFLNIDSSNRNKLTSINIKDYINISNYSIEFTDNSNFFKIYINNAIKYFKEDMRIILRGFRNYTIYYKNLNFFFTNNSPVLILYLKTNFNNTISYYDVFIKISGVFNENKNSWKNIPINLINQQHKINLNNINNDLKMSFILPINFYTDNEYDKTLISDCIIEYYSLGNYPINLINSNTPVSTNNLNPFLIINEVTNNYIKLYLKNTLSLNNNIILDGFWKNNVFNTGTNIQLGIIDEFIPGYPSSNNFSFVIDNPYNNICSIKMISSEIPNITQNINKDNNILNKNLDIENNLKYVQIINNKLYWENVIDSGIYVIELDSGFYTFQELKKNIEFKVSQIKRNFIFNDSYLYEYNMININFNIENEITTINFFDLYIYPDCLDSFTEINSDSNNIFIIRIYHKNHNLKVGDRVFIIDSIDYYTIKSEYINDINGYDIINVINNNYYEINIKNINKNIDVGNTKGGKNIKIKYFSNFRLFFNFSDTFGDLIGFQFSGFPDSITSYSTNFKNNIIDNKQPYYKDIQKIFIYDNIQIPYNLSTSYKKTNFRYILLLAENLNNNSNQNGPAFFYKILLNGSPNTYLFNTFVQTPIYFNPPIKTINIFKFTFIFPDGSLVNFNDLDLSFTLEITTINNIPENTNISTFVARI